MLKPHQGDDSPHAGFNSTASAVDALMENNAFADVARLILERIGDAVVIAGSDGRILLFNAAAREIIGSEGENLAACAEKYQLFLPDKTTLVPPGQLPLERAIRGESVDDSLVYQKRSNGSHRWLSAKAIPIRDQNSTIVAGALLCSDRTADVALEEQTMSQKTQEKLQTFAEAIPQLVWMAEPDGELTYFNKRWCDVLGLTAEESKDVGWHRIVHADDLQVTIDAWENNRTSGQDYEIEHRLLTVKGERWMITKAISVKDPGGKILYWIGTLTDVDDQKRASEQLKVMVKELESKTNEAQGSRNELKQLAYTISHELQSQMRTMTNVLRPLSVRYKGKMGADADEFIGQALVSGKSVERSLDGLWNYSQIEKNAVNLRSCQIAELIESARLNVQDLLDKREVVLKVEKLPELSINKSQIEYVFQQLLENAINFSEGIPEISISASERDGGWVFAVQDSGIGFDMMDADRIFSMFYKLNKNTPGTGMGLAICRRIVEAHGGRMWAKSTAGEGTVIYFSL